MKYSLHIDIDLPRDRVVALFDNPDNLPKWQPELVEIEPVEGIPGQPGGKTRLVYRMGSRELEMIETIRERQLPDLFSGTYSTSGMTNHLVNRFEDLGGKTRWHMENEFVGRGRFRIMTWLMPWTFKKQTLKTMKQFKTFAETGETIH